MADSPLKRIDGTLIVAGLGTAGALEALLARLGGLPARVLLIEPAETGGGAQARALAELPGVEVIDAVPGLRDAPVDLERYNLPGLRSLHPPTDALRRLYPGLQSRARVTTRTVVLADLVGDGADLPAPVRLHVDLPGSEAALLQALADCGALAEVAVVSMRCAADVMFADGWAHDALRAWLEERHFRAQPGDDEDPDWPELWMTADPAARRLAALQAEAEELRAGTAAQRDEITRLKERLEKREARVGNLETAVAQGQKALAEAQQAAADEVKALQAEVASHKERRQALEGLLEKHNRRATEMEDALLAADAALLEARETAGAEADALRKEAAAQAEKAAGLEETLARRDARIARLESMASERQARLQDQEEQLERRAARVEELQKALAAAKAAQAEQVARLDDLARTDTARGEKLAALQKRLNECGAELDETANALRSAKADAGTLSARLKEHDAQLARARQEREKALADLGLAMRMQALVQSDLDALRGRFQQSEATRTQQEALLRKLTPRLQQAAEQLRALHLTADVAEAPVQLAQSADTAEAAAPKAAPRGNATPKTPRKPRSRAAPSRKRATTRKTGDND